MEKILRYEEQEIEISLNDNIVKGYIIKKFNIESSINKHSRLELELEIAENEVAIYKEINQIEDCHIKINVKKSGKEKHKVNLFDGIILSSDFRIYGNKGYSIKLVGYSYSHLLDREKKYRAFQDITLTYEEIIKVVLDEYNNKNIKIIKNTEDLNKKITDLIIQFGETDYEFLMRILSHLGMGIITSEAGAICLGLIDISNERKEDKIYFEYSIKRENKNITYNLYSSQIFFLGNSVNLEMEDGENNFIVKNSQIELKNGLLVGKYELTSDKYGVKKIWNENIKGSVIEGVVDKVYEKNQIAVMEVSFYDGLQKYGTAYEDYGILKYPIPYATFYSQTNTGFFCTPETGDVVDILFLSEDEKFLRANGSVNSPGNGRFSDRKNRNFYVGNNFRFDLNIDKFKIEASSKYSVISPEIIESGSNVLYKAEKNILIASNDYLGLESIGATDIYASQLEIIGKEKEVVIESLNDIIRVKGKKIHNN